MPLPPGYTLDDEPAQTAPKLPKGYTLDSEPAMATVNVSPPPKLGPFDNNPGPGKPGGYEEALRPIGNFGRRIVNDAGAMAHQLVTPSDWAINKPVSYDNPISGYIRTAKQDGATQALTDAAGDATMMYLTGKAVGGATKLPGAIAEAPNVMQKLYPRAQSLTPTELGARGVAKALMVPPAAQGNFIPAMGEEGSSILDYAKRNNIPLGGTADFTKAAQGASKEIRGFYDQNVLGPTANNRVSVAGTNFRGKTFGEGPNTTLGEVDNRINEINKELNPNYRKALPSQTNAANVSDADLLAEKRALTNLLHKSLAESTGLQPEDIANLRQRAGKIKTIAEEAGLSDASNLTASGNAAMGKAPLGAGGKLGILDKALTALQGGPEIIGNRQINKALKNFSPELKPFPLITPPAEVAPLSRLPVRGASTPVPTFDATPNTAGAQQIMDNISTRNLARDAAAKAAEAARQQRLTSRGLKR